MSRWNQRKVKTLWWETLGTELIIGSLTTAQTRIWIILPQQSPSSIKNASVSDSFKTHFILIYTGEPETRHGGPASASRTWTQRSSPRTTCWSLPRRARLQGLFFPPAEYSRSCMKKEFKNLIISYYWLYYIAMLLKPSYRDSHVLPSLLASLDAYASTFPNLS